MAPRHLARVESDRSSGHPGASHISAFSSVVLPAPLRPTRTIFSPRFTIGVNAGNDVQTAERFFSPLNSSATLPDGRFIANLIYGRWMFERASSVVCSRSTSLRRDRDLARAGAGAEALDEVVQLRDLLLALRVVGFDS